MARILVVDDDTSNAEVLQLVLEEQQHEVVSIFSSRFIEATIRNFMPELIVMDILLDRGDGRILSNALKQGHTTKHIPILLITAMLEFQAHAVPSMADVLMFKPFDYRKLGEKVSALIAHSGVIRE